MVFRTELASCSPLRVEPVQAMFSSVVCSRDPQSVQQNIQESNRQNILQNIQQSGVTLRIEPRRNSAPPAQTPMAKHLLAYLPRSQPRPVHSAPFFCKVEEDPRLNSTMPPPSRNLTYPVCSSALPTGESCLVETGQGAPGPVEVPPRPQRSQRSRNLKRFSSRWQSRSSTCSSGPPAPLPEKTYGSRTHRKRCKLLGDETSPHVAAGNRRQRYVAKDGKCQVNLGPIAEKSRFLSDIFTTLVDLKYRWFLLVFSLCYVLTWVAFGGIYFLGAWLRDDLAHADDRRWQACYQNVDGFLSALLLSLESQRTIGYGSRAVTARCPEGAVLLMVQSILGSIIDALMVGCMFVKISRPQQRAQTLIFGKHCVVCERDGRLCMLFRIGDLRESHMVDAKVRAKLIRSRQTAEGEFIPLEQSEINLGYDSGGDRLLLVEPQTITHVIDPRSPFWEVGAHQLTREAFEIIVILEGIVEASGMTCQARTSYTEDEILWGHRFQSCISMDKGAYRVDYSAFHKTFEVQMSKLSQKDRTSAEERGGTF